MLELDLNNALIEKINFVLCLSYFSSGENTINIKFGSMVDKMTLGIRHEGCTKLCKVYIFIEGQLFLMKEEILSNRWIFLCVTFDIFNQDISLAIDNIVVFQHKLVLSQIKAPSNIQKVSIWWEDEIYNFKFPEKLTLINIHSNSKTVDKFNCGEPGDLYAWNLEGWKLGGGKPNDSLLTSQESTYQICQTTLPVYVLPKLNFKNALQMCKNMNGNMYYAQTAFEELAQLEGKWKPSTEMGFFLPYTDENEEGVLKHVYSNSSFTSGTEYFKGQPNGGNYENCLNYKLISTGLWDCNCVISQSSLCQIPKSSSYLTLRGLCPETEVERVYSSGNKNGAFIWIGHRHAHIQYTSRWFLNSKFSRNVWAESEASYSSLLIGTQAWEIHNDTQCHGEVYTTNLSLRLVI